MYINTRGNKTVERPYCDLSADERHRILIDYIDTGIKRTCTKWNIKNQTLRQLKYFYRNVIEKIEDERFKERGL